MTTGKQALNSITRFVVFGLLVLKDILSYVGLIFVLGCIFTLLLSIPMSVWAAQEHGDWRIALWGVFWICVGFWILRLDSHGK